MPPKAPKTPRTVTVRAGSTQFVTSLARPGSQRGRRFDPVQLHHFRFVLVARRPAFGPVRLVSDSPRDGFLEVPGGGDVVAAEHRARRPAAELHRHVLRDARADQIPGRAAPKVVGGEAQ